MSSNFLIADFKTGLQRNIDPWLLPSDAFPNLSNSYLYRGVVRKKGGADLLGQLVSSPVLPTIFIDGPVVGLARFQTPNINAEQLVAFGIDTSIGAPNIRANYFDATANQFFETPGVTLWLGGATDLFWHTNFRDQIYVTNYVFGATPTTANSNPIRRTSDPITVPYANFIPVISNVGTDVMRTCRILLPYKNRFVALSTLEGSNLLGGTYTEFPQRVRWSSAIDPTDTVTNWNQDIGNGGGFVDAPTNERIINAGFVKDSLIVYFERSTWQLAWRNNKAQPFIWKRIDAEFGSESTFSVVQFDEGAMGIGYNGIFQSSPLGTQRIDLKIPDEAFGFRNSPDAVQQIYGIRDFYAQSIYWSFANLAVPQTDPVFNNSILYFNYSEKSWAIFEGSYTTFGYYNEATTPPSATWGSLSVDPDHQWQNVHTLWGTSPLQQNFPIVVAGNQKGRVHKVYWGDPFASSQSEAVMFDVGVALGSGVTNADPAVVTVVNHNLLDFQYVTFTNFSGVVPADWVTALTDVIFQVKRLTADTFSLQTLTLLVDPDGDWIDFDSIIGGAGGILTPFAGTMDVTQVMSFLIQTKRLNPAVQEGEQIRLVYSDLYLTVQAELDSLNIPVNEFNLEMQVDTNPEIIQSMNVSLFNENQEKIWKRVYLNSICNFFTLYFSLNPRQIANKALQDQKFFLHAINLNTRAAGGRITQ